MQPTQPHELVGAQTVTVARAVQGGIPRSVGLDGEQPAPAVVGVLHDEVDAVVCRAEVLVDGEAFAAKAGGKVAAKRVGRGRRVGEEGVLVAVAGLGIREEVPQHGRPTGLEAGRIEIARPQGGDDRHARCGRG